MPDEDVTLTASWTYTGGKQPKTGDELSMMVLLALAGAAVLEIIMIKRKERSEA